MGYKFIRQYLVDHYILDFYCPAKKLGIELDGAQHAEHEVRKYDEIRTIHLEFHGIKILRFWNSDVKNKLNNVLVRRERIRKPTLTSIFNCARIHLCTMLD